jgi:hypothetical protein
MSVTILCPKLTCRAVLRVPDQIRGKRIRCGECGTAFLVPERPRTSAPSSPPEMEAAPPDPHEQATSVKPD